MKNKLFFFTMVSVLLLTLIFLISCSKVKDIIQEPPVTNLIEESIASETTNTTATTVSETTAIQASESTPPATIGSDEDYNPVINPSDFSTKIDNKYFPLIPGTTFIYDGISEKGQEHNEMVVTSETKQILGVECIVVLDTVMVNGQMIEQTLDWYAQDKDGNVWYFGEDSKEYENGEVVSTEGSWEAGVNGAKPGIIMESNPNVGDSYRQEYFKGEAEDMAKILSLTESASVKYGNFNNCLKTRDYTPLEPDVAENKYFAPGVGEVLVTLEKGGTERMELTEIRTEATK